MRVLLVFCHPDPGSFTAAIKDALVAEAEQAGASVSVIDLYANGFDPMLSRPEWQRYEQVPMNRAGVEDHLSLLEGADTLLFVYPTWWYGLPALLKGWLDRVLLPGSAFILPADGGDIRPGLTNIRRLGVFTTCGASRWLTFFVGAPGKRTLLRGVRLLCHPRVRTAFAAHYSMDSSTPESRARHLDHAPRVLRRLLAKGPRPEQNSGKDNHKGERAA